MPSALTPEKKECTTVIRALRYRPVVIQTNVWLRFPTIFELLKPQTVGLLYDFILLFNCFSEHNIVVEISATPIH